MVEVEQKDRRRGRKSYAEQIASTSDDRWAEWTLSLLIYLKTPRSWSELRAWRERRGFSGCRLRHMIAWLDMEGLVECEGRGELVVWRLKGARR